MSPEAETELTHLEQLVGVALDELRVHHGAGRGDGVHVLLQVHGEELEDEVEPVLLHDDVLQVDDVGVVELLEEGDFPDGCRGDTFLLGLQADLLHGHDLTRLLVLALWKRHTKLMTSSRDLWLMTDLEDDSVSSLSDLLDLEEVVELGGRLGHAGHLCFSGV